MQEPKTLCSEKPFKEFSRFIYPIFITQIKQLHH